MRYLVLILSLFVVGCSSNWHLKRAIKKNPNLLDSLTYEKTITIRDTIHDTILIPEHNFDFNLDSSLTKDTFSTVYEDSTVIIQAKKEGNATKLKGKVKTRYITRTIYRTRKIKVPCNCPPQVVLMSNKDKFMLISGYLFWILLVISILAFIFTRK